ncbi:MAG TPA: dolichyl-phosphate beta-glucosyltransferase [Terriglobales bacterium]|nr:dolichyl-phosphate beta-glucosyltransferase [Terriglobales bacterium]
MPAPYYSIIVPAYNEAERIGASLEHMLAYMGESRWSAEIIVVNDGSSDNTAAVVQEYARRNPIIRILENPGNRGKGYSVRNGMLNASGQILLFTDADLSSPIEEAEKLFAVIENGEADVAIGSRYLRSELQTRKQPLHRRMMGRAFNLALKTILGLSYADTQCGFKAFSRKAVMTIFPNMKIERWGFDPEILFLARRYGLRVAEIPVSWAHDHRSKINPLRDGTRMLGELLRVRMNSMGGKYVAPSTQARIVTKTA